MLQGWTSLLITENFGTSVHGTGCRVLPLPGFARKYYIVPVPTYLSTPA